MVHNKLRSSFWLALSSCCLIALLGACSGYTPQGRVATWEESIIFFEKNKKDFEGFRDLLLAEKESRFIVYDTGDCVALTKDGPLPSIEHQKEYVARLNKLGLPCASKTFVDDPKYPIVSFGISATGLVGNGPSVELYFAKKDPGFAQRGIVKIEKTGWYLESQKALKRSEMPE